MGTVNLLPVEPQGNKTIEEYIRYIANILAMFQEDLQNILEGRISADNIRAESIETKNLKAGAITTDKIAAGAVVAGKIDVNQLSAISADMGTINAGSITTNAQINVGTDARIGNILYLNETDGDGSKGVIFSTESGKTARISAQSGDVSISAGGFVTFTIGSSQGLVVNQKVTAPVLAATSAVTINGEVAATEGYVNTGLAGKANAFTGYNGSIAVNGGANTMNFNNGILTSIT